MTEPDQMLEDAATDLRSSIAPTRAPDVSIVKRRHRSRRTIAIVSVVALAIVGSVWAFQPAASPDRTITSDNPVGVTSDAILRDGVVTRAEYEAGAEAVARCLIGAGFDTQVTFDDPNGHAGFSAGPESARALDEWQGQFDACLDAHLSASVSLGWAAALGQVDLETLRAETVATLECVEDRVGIDFGHLTYDEFGYPTAEARRTQDAAFEFDDHQPWTSCREEVGSTGG